MNEMVRLRRLSRSFVKNEFQDLPWAHSRISALHLGKLYRAGELFPTASCRYMLMDDDVKFDERKEKGWRVGRRRKKNKRERNCRGGETLERIEGSKRRNELNERENEQNHLFGQVVQGQGEAQKQPNENTNERIQEAIMDLKDKISSSKIMNTEPQMVSLVPPYDSIVDKKNPRYCKIKKQLQLRPQDQGWGRGRGRSYKLDGNSHQHNEQLQLPDQTPTLVGFPSLEPNEIIYPSPAPDLLAASSLQQLVDSSSEESLGCIMGETAALQLELQMSWNRLVYGGITSQMEDSLSSMNHLEDKPQQHRNKGGHWRKLNLDGKTEFEHLEQQLSKRRCIGGPSDPGSTEECSWSWVPLVPSNNCIRIGKKNQISATLWNIGSCSPQKTKLKFRCILQFLRVILTQVGTSHR